MTWHTDPPTRRSAYLVVDRMYRGMTLAHWTPEQGWCIRGRWLGHDGAECWMELPAMPLRPTEKHFP